jgi:hypothetical protein
MIIQPDRDSFLFITQPDHARLAADAITHWKADAFADHPRRSAILLATREHDNGWIEEDAETYVDTAGAPLDFVAVPASIRQRIWPRAVQRLSRQHPYAAALIAQHAIAVYSASRNDEGWESFFEELSELRDRCLGAAGLHRDTLDGDYRFVNAADRLSLAFCTGWPKPLESYGRQIILKGQVVEITPDPFEGARVPLAIAARRLRRQHYKSSGDLRAALRDAPVEILRGEAAGTA